jgi:hypothetical protein
MKLRPCKNVFCKKKKMIKMGSVIMIEAAIR